MAKLKIQKASGYVDNRGVDISDVRFLLPIDKLRWPKIKRVEDKRVCAFMHRQFDACWWCGEKAQAHHMFAGSRGSSDELCAIAMLCELHHGQLKEPILPLGYLLWLKWYFDPLHVDWVRMTLLNGYHLPDIIVPDWYTEDER